MEEKKNQPCPNCGQSVSRDFIKINGKLYCGMCRPHEDRTVETGADDGVDKTQVLQTGAERTQPGADADRTMAVADDGRTLPVGSQEAGKTMAIGGDQADKTMAIGSEDAGKTMAIAGEDGGKTVAIGAEAGKTVAIGGQPGDRTATADRTQAADKTQATGAATATGAAADSRAQSSAQASRSQRTGTWASTLFTMNKSLAATKVIRDVLKISPDVDLEHASKMYYTRHGRQMSKDDAATIQDLIARSNADSKYIYDKELGRGGMGAVFSTVDQDVRRKVAMKVMLPSTATSPAHIKRFLEEAQITGQLEHPNIVPVHEVGINEESNIYFTMKMVRGENLDEVLDKIAQGKAGHQQKYSLGVLLQIFMKVCDAIGYSHAKGVLHRDLKPENLMVGDFGEVLVMDWGLAKVLGREDINTGAAGASEQSSAYHTMEGQVMGTPAYMSPEQALGKISELDERSDIFSLGGILYKILTYQAPYRGKNAREALEKARKRQLQSPDLRAPERKIPAELVAICMKAMAREKDERYGSAEELKDDIQRYLDGKSVSAKKDSLLLAAKKWVIRNKVASMGIAGAIVCLIVGSMGAAAYQQQQKHATIAALLTQGDQFKTEGKFEQAEETFFSVLGLDLANTQARQGIAEVSGKSLALKNKRLAGEKIKDAEKIAAAAPVLDKKIADITDKVEKDKAGLKGYEGYDRKKPVWDEERALLAATIDRLKTEGRVISKYTEILSLDGENKEARAALSKIYYEKYRDAETLRQGGDMAYYKELILAFDDGAYKALLDKQGTLSLSTAPAAEGYFIFRFVEGPDRRLVPAPFSPQAFFAAPAQGDTELRGIDPQFKLEATASMPLGKLLAGKDFNRVSQIDNLRMPAGSYIVIVQKPGYVETRIPVVVDRGQEKKIEAVKLLKDDDVPKGFVYVPKGEFISGGDPEAPNSPKRSLRMLPGFLMSLHEVTVGEYVKFLNFQESVRPGSAENYLPRKSVDSGFYWQKLGSQYQPSFALDWPVLGVAQVDARLYCKWLTKAGGDRWEFRLPEELEWEKASRGVDGRIFPWGNYFDFSFCSMGKSKDGRREGPDKVGVFHLDASVYGAEDMAGNVSEWTASFLGQDQAIALYKGSGWSKIEDKFARCASRNGDIPEAVDDSRGFRIAISIKE
ncbi:MAG: bifunctional serine/threonine-protein kinase/formylglycine-generating enzyme family protein [Proteobacteria bacterium]|nr:bifunctional serine/threonine-protein kinase/formylglycine-generating enzyme family protein [Pseudomonadota bacterium]